MVGEVSKIIYNTLIVHRAVTLPGVGTLTIVQRSASMRSKREVVAPHFAIEFSSREFGVSLVDAISWVTDFSTKDAEEIYTRWLDKVRDGNKLSICDIGTLNNKTFVAEKSLLAQLNSDSNRVIKLPKRGRRWLYIATIVLLAIVATGVVFLLAMPSNEVGMDRVVEEENSKPMQTPESVDNTLNVEDNTIPPETTIIAETESVVETNINSEDTATEETPIVSGVWSDNPDIRHWVVAGSYSTEANANRALDKICKQHPDIHCEQFKLGKMFAVAVYGSTTIDECEEFMRAEKNRLGALWIHTPKRFK